MQCSRAHPPRPRDSLAPAPPQTPTTTTDWLAGLASFMAEVGIPAGLIEETLLRLRAAGATEQQLRSTATHEDLERMGIEPGPRCAAPGMLFALLFTSKELSHPKRSHLKRNAK